MQARMNSVTPTTRAPMMIRHAVVKADSIYVSFFFSLSASLSRVFIKWGWYLSRDSLVICLHIAS